jgi:hypothetical protein
VAQTEPLQALPRSRGPKRAPLRMTPRRRVAEGGPVLRVVSVANPRDDRSIPSQHLGRIHRCGSATRSDCLDGQSSPKKRPLAGGSAGPSRSGCPEVVEMRKECVGEPGCPLGFANLSITLGSRGAAVVSQLSFRGRGALRPWIPQDEGRFRGKRPRRG